MLPSSIPQCRGEALAAPAVSEPGWERAGPGARCRWRRRVTPVGVRAPGWEPRPPPSRTAGGAAGGHSGPAGARLPCRGRRGGCVTGGQGERVTPPALRPPLLLPAPPPRPGAGRRARRSHGAGVPGALHPEPRRPRLCGQQGGHLPLAGKQRGPAAAAAPPLAPPLFPAGRRGEPGGRCDGSAARRARAHGRLLPSRGKVGARCGDARSGALPARPGAGGSARPGAPRSPLRLRLPPAPRRSR